MEKIEELNKLVMMYSILNSGNLTTEIYKAKENLAKRIETLTAELLNTDKEVI